MKRPFLIVHRISLREREDAARIPLGVWLAVLGQGLLG